MLPTRTLLNSHIRVGTGRMTPIPGVSNLIPSTLLPHTRSPIPTSYRRQSSPSSPSGPGTPPPAPRPHGASIPVLARPGGFGMLQFTRYATAMLPPLYAWSVPGLADLWGTWESAAFFAASFVPLLFVRWATAPYVYAAEWILPPGIRGREAVKLHLSRAPLRELGELAVRRMGGGGKIGGMGGAWASISGKWEKVRIEDLRRKKERLGVVDFVDRTGRHKFYFGEGSGKVREGWVLGEMMRRIPRWEGEGM